jgi:hypothetical protein
MPAHSSQSSSNNLSGNDWELLGELELIANPDVDDAIEKWITKTVRPLKLPASFLHGVLKSTQEALGRTIRLDAGVKTRCVQLRLFIPAERTSQEQTWGYFRVEKIENTGLEAGLSNHVIENYLYLEGG